MTPTDVKAMTTIVRAILRGQWTFELPDWAPADTLQESDDSAFHGLRAVQTAEAFIVLCDSCKYPLNQTEFLQQCGFTR